MTPPDRPQRWNYQQVLQLAAVVLALLVLLGGLKNLFLKQVLIGLGPKVIGARLEVDHISLSLVRQRMAIKGFKLYNPDGFPNEVMLDVPEVSVRLNPWRMLTGRLTMSAVVINMKELVIIKNADKKLNVDALKIAQSGKDPPAKEGEPVKKAKRPKFFIQELRLNVEQVVVKDFSKGETPVIQVYDIPLKDKVIRDVDSFEKLMTVLIVHAMGPTAIKSAGIYAAAAVLGVGFLPAGILGIMVADDDSVLVTRMSRDKAFDFCRDFIADRGTMKKQHREKGYLTAKIDGYDVRFDIAATEAGETAITVSARKFMLPKSAFAGGIVYQLRQRMGGDAR
ncbi:MAG: hypothetical protein KC897_05875 [Candidatus Omnitrophica bacterium]|nr:hypothetical protein [Candidatus Omnitrophota bacterium]MCB9720433.1 hypothetical protein [Candidatus Omnitrophota bacterium]